MGLGAWAGPPQKIEMVVKSARGQEWRSPPTGHSRYSARYCRTVKHIRTTLEPSLYLNVQCCKLRQDPN